MIHETSYERERKEVEIDHVKIDFLDIRNGVLHEVKKSDSWHQAHEWQVLYYLYVLKQKSVCGLRGELNYPVIRRTIQLELTEEREQKLQDILHNIQSIINLPVPSEISMKNNKCSLCSYFELCYI